MTVRVTVAFLATTTLEGASMNFLSIAGLVAVASVLAGSSAHAASFSFDFSIPPGSSQLFKYEVAGDYEVTAFIYQGGWYEYIDHEWSPPAFTDFDIDSFGTDCGNRFSSLPCVSYAYPMYSPAGFIKLSVVDTFEGFTVLAENRLRSVDDCTTDMRERLVCGWSPRWNAGLSIGVEADDPVRFTVTPLPAPEPATWAMMIAGFGLVGASLRAKFRAERSARELFPTL